MRLDIYEVCKFYITAMIVNHKFSHARDPGMSVLVVSHFENAFKMIDMKRSLKENELFNGALARTNPLEPVLPSNADVERLIHRVDRFSSHSNRAMIVDSIYFYHQVKISIPLTPDQIANDPWIKDINEIPSVYEVKTSIEDGKRADRYGIANINLKNLKQAAKHLVGEHFTSSKDYVEESVKEYFESTTNPFKTFKKEYRRFKEQIVEKSKENYENYQIKFEAYCESLRSSGLRTEERMQRSLDYTRKKGILERLKTDYEKNKRELDELPAGYEGSELTPQEERELQTYISYLKRARKDKLRERGYNTDNFLFQDRPNSFYKHEVDPPVMPSASAEILKLYDLYDEFLRHELEMKRHVQAIPRHLTTFFVDVEKISEEEVAELIAAGTIHGRLNAIDEHAYSAKSIVERVGERGFEYGTEMAHYPVNLARYLIATDQKRNFVGLCNSEDHKHGMRSVLFRDNENIFVEAYERIDPDRQYLTALARVNFPFTPDQKKAIFKTALDNDNEELFRALVVGENPPIDLFEYQKDRGITFFHDVLIKGRSNIKNVIRESVTITHPNQKVSYIPYPIPEPKTIVRSRGTYWLPHFDNVEISETKFVGNKAKKTITGYIKKGWDNLTIAAAADNMEMFSYLLRFDVDTALCMKVLPSLPNGGGNKFKVVLESHIQHSPTRNNTGSLL